MYKLAGKRKLGRKASHRRALVQNQVRSLLISGKVETTTPKAKVLKANAESLFNKEKYKDEKVLKDTLISMSLSHKEVAKVLEYLNADPKVTVVKVGFRAGDNAELSKVRLVGYSKKDKKAVQKSKSTQKSEDKVDEKESTKDSLPVDPDKKGPSANDPKGGKITKSLKSKLSRQERARSRSGI